jgi:hypothetical protein
MAEAGRLGTEHQRGERRRIRQDEGRGPGNSGPSSKPVRNLRVIGVFGMKVISSVLNRATDTSRSGHWNHEVVQLVWMARRTALCMVGCK